MATASPSANIQHRPAAERGATRIGWLDSKHSFSFGGYHNPQRMGYHGLRVLNDDRVAPAQGFGTHPHRDMEILTWVLDGELAHRDSMGHRSTLPTGTAQLMSAGTGVTHSEFNASDSKPVHFLQVWIQPAAPGAEPRYAELTIPADRRRGSLVPLGTLDGRDGSLVIGADAEVYVADLDPETPGPLRLQLPGDRVAYVHQATGSSIVNGHTLEAGDALTLEAVDQVILAAAEKIGQVLIFSLPA